MNKKELVEALRDHRARSSPRGPAGQVPARPPGTRLRRPSEGQPPLSEVDAAMARPAADARRRDRCAIVYESSGRRGEFHVVVTAPDGSRRSVGRSPAFRAPRFGPPRRWGPAWVAHELLVSRLEACGWWPVTSGGPWHELGFVRLRGEDARSRRSLVTVVREAGEARFVGEELDTYGNPTPLVVSAAFSAPRFLGVRPSMEARAALNQLVRRMESEGWNVAAAVGDDWYAISLWRPVTATRGRALGDNAGDLRPWPHGLVRRIPRL
jgi:hypothetical protein